MINIQSLQVHYGNHLALDIRRPITIEKGDRVGILGSNGAGKTTLLNALLGIIPSKGKFSLEVDQEAIAVHMQANEYLTTVSVRSVMEAILGEKIEKRQDVMDLIRFFDFEESLKKKFQNLSGGQKQRLTLILVIAQKAPLIFFDEVTSGLDFDSRQALVSLISEHYQDRESTLCFITHYYEELENFADKLLLLDKGQVIDYGEKQELFHKYCGDTVFILDNTQENKKLTEDFRHLAAPAHLLALSANSKEEAINIAQRLMKADINYKRTNADIEIMTVNAKKHWEGGRS